MNPRHHAAAIAALILCLPAGVPSAARAAAPQPGPPLTIRRIQGAITVDGDLSDAGWQGVEGVTQWYETRVGDNVEPQVKNVGYLAYDDKYLYAGFRFEDPNPSLIRAPLGDHDALSGTTDYGGIIVDSRNDGKTAQMFLANANGLQYDAISSDITGEDNSPDWFWDAAGKVTEHGYTLEIRVPFSSLRYANTPAPTWGILLYRNFPRERHYQFFSSKLPRDVNCMVCNSSKLSGLENLPHGSHLVVAPYTTVAQRSGTFDELGVARAGLPWQEGKGKPDVGADIKWAPFTGLAVDATIRPDFSQVEADAGQLSTNERFALFVPEKRSFFLEGVDLFSAPLQAVYTRTINAPDFGLRATGRAGSTAFTTLYAHDRGQGFVILPGPFGSGFGLQDFESDVAITRFRHDYGQSFVSVLGTFRESDGSAYNRVLGPDFQWRPRPNETVTGQLLWSDTRTPDRPDLQGSAPEWDGRRLQDHAAILNWQHSSRTMDWYLQGQELGLDFRADEGFIPQVGYREAYGQVGYTVRPQKSFYSRIRTFAEAFNDFDMDGNTLNRHYQLGVGADGRYASFTRLELNQDEFLVGSRMLKRLRPRLQLEASPTRTLNNLSLVVAAGQDVDFANAREGTGASVSLNGTWRPDDHIAVNLQNNWRWLDVDDPVRGSGRLFTDQVERVRATYMFNSRMFLRVIGQLQRTDRKTALYGFTVPARSSDLSGSALFAYKVNFQTVFYAGYGDQRLFSQVTDRMEPASRQAFAKISYAWQQ